MKTKSQHKSKKEIIHLNESHQLKHTGVKLKALVPKVSTLQRYFSWKDYQDWTSDRLAEVQGATKVTVQGKEYDGWKYISHTASRNAWQRLKRAQNNHSVCTSIEINCVKQCVMVPMLKWTMHTGVPVTAGIGVKMAV